MNSGGKQESNIYNISHKYQNRDLIVICGPEVKNFQTPDITDWKKNATAEAVAHLV